MKSILIGNGVNIQFGGKSHFNKEIILRVIDACKSSDFPRHIIVDDPILVLQCLGLIYSELSSILKGEYDQFAVATFEKEEMTHLKRKYLGNQHLIMTDIGFEDYYFLFDMVCRKHKIVNPDRYFARETLKRVFIYAIYNNGSVNDVYKIFSPKFIRYLLTFDNVFTTNYDSNLEKSTGMAVHHLHGSFDRRADVYNPDSLRNQMSDAPIKTMKIDTDYEYLYSTALTDYSGSSKDFSMGMARNANSGLEKFVEGYKNNPSIMDDVDRWSTDSNELVRKMAEGIKLKQENPELHFIENFPLEQFEGLRGTLVILGLSISNDTHLFKKINDNPKIENIVYYYFDKNDKPKVLDSFSSHKEQVVFEDVKGFWKEMI